MVYNMAFWDELTKGAKDAAAFTMKKTEELTNLAKAIYLYNVAADAYAD
jgi:hypothetical protein